MNQVSFKVKVSKKSGYKLTLRAKSHLILELFV